MSKTEDNGVPAESDVNRKGRTAEQCGSSAHSGFSWSTEGPVSHSGITLWQKESPSEHEWAWAEGENASGGLELGQEKPPPFPW